MTLYNTPKQEKLIFDIGMHKGEDSEFYLKKGFQVVAFEADPELARDCANRLKRFIEIGQLTIVPGAIVSRDTIAPGQTKVRFYKNTRLSVWGTVFSDWADRNERLGHSSEVVEVDAIDFAEVMQRYGVPRYMKIDIEGADMVCVNTLNQFRERPDYVSIESNKTCFAGIKGEIEILSSLGYDFFQAVEQSSIPRAQVPPKPAREGAYVAHQFPEGSSGLFGLELSKKWKTKRNILADYSVIRLGYYLVGDDGVLARNTSRGLGMIRRLVSRGLKIFTKAPVPGWYDTHARHSSATGNDI